MITEVDGRATEIRSFVFGTGLRKRLLVSSTGYVLDSKGRIALVTDAVATQATVGMSSVSERMRELVRLATAAIEEAILPPVAHAASTSADELCVEETDEQAVAEGGSCWWAAGRLAIAVVAYEASAAAYLIALDQCLILPPTCVSVAPAFRMMVAGAAAVVEAGRELSTCLAERCKKKADTTSTSPPVGGGGGGGGSGGPSPTEDCREVVFEISYDDGLTWEYWRTEIICN